MEYLSFKRRKVYTTGWQRKTFDDNDADYTEEVATVIEVERNSVIIAQVCRHSLDGKFLWGYHPASLYPAHSNIPPKVGISSSLTEAREAIQALMTNDPYIQFVEMSRHQSGIMPRIK